MNWLTIAWSMCAGICVTLSLLHVFLWIKNRNVIAYLLSALMALSASAIAITELSLLHSQSIVTYQLLMQWLNVFIYLLIIPMVWLVYVRLNNSQRWLAQVITAMWSVSLIFNFTSPGSLVFEHVDKIEQHTTYWGEQYSVAIGPANPWVLLANIAVVLILIYVIIASIRAWRRDEQQQAIIIGGGIVVFMLFAGIHSMLVDNGIVTTPYMVSFAYLAIVVAMSYELVNQALQVPMLKREVVANEKRWQKAQVDLQHTQLEMERMMRVTILGELASALAHELNQPLAAILSNAQAARRLQLKNKLEPDELLEILDDIVRDDKRAGEVIHGLRTLLRRGEVKKTKSPVNAIVQDALRIINSEIEVQGIKLELDLAENMPEIVANQVELQQVIINLVLNAIRIQSDNLNGEQLIYIKVGLLEGMIMFQVRDNGPGINQADMDKVFQPFFSTRSNGLGMGLTLSRRIVDAHGGQIWAENHEEGGAIINFTIPVATK